MTSPKASGGDPRLALSAGVLCYLIWGFVPLAFQTIGRHGVGPWEILAQRIVWSVPAAAVFVLLAGQARQVAEVLRRPRVLAWLGLSSLLISINWVVFISAVTDGRLLETSLGYYINPLVNMAAGALLFRERIDRIGYVAIGLALVGVVFQAAALGHLPWVSLILAFSFAGYGVVRKQVAADAQTGLLVECLILSLPSLAFIGWLHVQAQSHFTQDLTTTAWLIASGPITAVPWCCSPGPPAASRCRPWASCNSWRPPSASPSVSARARRSPAPAPSPSASSGAAPRSSCMAPGAARAP